MSLVICVMGESGSGKTTAMRTLDPESTYYIDADGKGLSWKGWREQYNAERKNYWRGSDKERVQQILAGIDGKRPDIKTVVIDTINAIMVDDEMARAAEKGYDKWMDLAWAVYGMIVFANRMRDDITVIFVAHTQTERDENTGERWTRSRWRASSPPC